MTEGDFKKMVAPENLSRELSTEEEEILRANFCLLPEEVSNFDELKLKKGVFWNALRKLKNIPVAKK